MIAISMRPICGQALALHRIRNRLGRRVGVRGRRREALVAIAGVGLENDATAGLPFLEAIGAGADRMVHRAAALIGVFLDHLAGHGAQRRTVENLEERVVGLDQLQPQRVAIGRAQALYLRVVVEAARRLRLRHRSVEPDELVFEQVRVGRAHARVDDALPRVDEIRRGQFALLAAKRGVVREIDAGPDADRPDATVRRYFRHAGRDARHEPVRPRKIVPDIECVEDPRFHDGRVSLLRAGRIESRDIDRKRDLQNLRGIGPIRREALRRDGRNNRCQQRSENRGTHRHWSSRCTGSDTNHRPPAGPADGSGPAKARCPGDRAVHRRYWGARAHRVSRD